MIVSLVHVHKVSFKKHNVIMMIPIPMVQTNVIIQT